MSDLLTNLRALASAPGHTARIIADAVDEIERLRARVAELEKELGEIVPESGGRHYTD